jgi:hypothetical protein
MSVRQERLGSIVDYGAESCTPPVYYLVGKLRLESESHVTEVWPNYLTNGERDAAHRRNRRITGHHRRLARWICDRAIGGRELESFATRRSESCVDCGRTNGDTCGRHRGTTLARNRTRNNRQYADPRDCCLACCIDAAKFSGAGDAGCDCISRILPSRYTEALDRVIANYVMYVIKEPRQLSLSGLLRNRDFSTRWHASL